MHSDMRAHWSEGAPDVKPRIEAQFNTEIQTRLKRLAWNKVQTDRYKDGYKFTDNGCGGSRECRRRTRRRNPDDYIGL